MQEILTRVQQDIRLRGLSPLTESDYLERIATFVKWTNNKSESELTEQDFREFLQYLINERNLRPGTVNSYNSAIRFLFGVTFDRIINLRQVPRLRHRRKLPDILTKEEMSTILSACDNLRDRAILMLLYGSGLRLSEVCKMKVSHIDSVCMRVFVDNGKGGKDRYTILSAECLLTLREYWKAYRPKDWLFLNRDKDNHITWRCVQDLLKKYVRITNLKKHITIHTLRQAFATHLLEAGVDVAHIKTLLGHTHIQSTTFYLHVANIETNIKSPLDTFDKPKKKRGRPSKQNESGETTND